MFQYFLVDAQSGSTDKNARDIIRRWLEDLSVIGGICVILKFEATSLIILIVVAKDNGHEYEYCGYETPTTVTLLDFSQSLLIVLFIVFACSSPYLRFDLFFISQMFGYEVE